MGVLERSLKLARETRHYPCLRHKLLSFYNLLLVSRKLRHLPLPGRKQVVHVRLRNQATPFCVRLGSTDWLVLVEIFVDDEYGATRGLLLSHPPETILDLGANCGYSVRYWLSLFPDANVVAVEPDAANFDMMRRNVSHVKQDRRLRLVCACAIGGADGEVFLDSGGGREWACAVQSTPIATSKRVAGKTVKTILAECGVSGEIELLKCDIEGSEAELFEHCELWIHRVRTVVVEVHGDFTVAKLLSLLGRKGVEVAVHPSKKSNICTFQVLSSQP